MPTYTYRVKTTDGEVLEDRVSAANRQDALSAVFRRGEGTVVDLREDRAGVSVPGAPPPLPARSAPRLKGGWIRSRDLTVFFRQLAVSVNAGVSLREALESIIEDLEHAKLRRVLQRVCDRLHEGASFSQGLAADTKTFPPLCVALIRTAEEAGTMPRTLDQLATNLEKSDALARKIKSIMAYPMFIAVFFVLVLLIMTFFILPQFQDIFEGWGAELPVLTRAVFTVNKFLIHNVVLEVAVLTLLLVGFLLWRRTETGRAQLDRIKLALPGFGDVLRKVAFARFCKNFAMMVRGGVPVTQGMEIAAGVTVNKVIERALMNARERIMLGSDIGGSLGREEIFPRLLVRMVSIGESSGRLPDVLDKVADTYESEVEGAVMVATSLLEPVIIVFFGAIVLLFVLAIYLPVFTTAAHMQ